MIKSSNDVIDIIQLLIKDLELCNIINFINNQVFN